jgi:hypothetical protein
MRYTWMLLAMTVASCGASIPFWTKDYAQSVTTHSYADVAPAQALQAARTVITLAASPHNADFTDRTDGFEAHRYFTGISGMTPLTGDYVFQVTATAAGKGSILTVNIRDDSQYDSIAFPDVSISPTSYSGGPIQVRGPYDLFFARVDALLGKRKDWITCAAAPAALNATIGLDALCRNARDAVPLPKG